MKTLHVFPNPYGHLDHKGRLAGACPQAEGRRQDGAMPSRKLVGAELKMVAGSYESRDVDGDYRKSRADVFFQFDAVAPVAVNVETDLAGWYEQRHKNGEVFVCESADALPIEALASARLKACAEFKAAYGSEPDSSAWDSQFPLDKVVAEAAKALAEDRKSREVEAPKPVDHVKAADEARKEALEKASKQAAKFKEDLAKRGKTPAAPVGNGAPQGGAGKGDS